MVLKGLRGVCDKEMSNEIMSLLGLIIMYMVIGWMVTQIAYNHLVTKEPVYGRDPKHGLRMDIYGTFWSIRGDARIAGIFWPFTVGLWIVSNLFDWIGDESAIQKELKQGSDQRR